MMKLPKILALDPGGTTGAAIWRPRQLSPGSVDYRRQIDTFQMGPEPHHETLWKLLTSEDPDVVVWESFEFRQYDRKDRHNIVLVSKEYIGVAELYVALTKKPSKSQTAATGKAFWTDDKLKKVGLYEPGKPHAMDALRHALHFAVFELKQKDILHKLRT